MTARIVLLGRPRLEIDATTAPKRPRGRKAWAVLARCALSDSAVPRRELADELFTGADDPVAALRWTLADLRRALGRPDLLRGDPVSLPRDGLRIDVWEDDASRPDSEVGAELLEGIEVRDCPGFDAWLLVARAEWAARGRQELRLRALQLLAAGETASAAELAGRAARRDPWDEGAQELFLRALVADGRDAVAAAYLSSCEALFLREGLTVSTALREAARPRPAVPTRGVRAAVVAASLLRAGSAALDAGATDGGVETLRRAAADAERTADPALQAEVLHALGSALVHAVRGHDGEGAVLLHRALLRARLAGRHDLVAEALRELAFTDIQAGRHESASRALLEARSELDHLDDAALQAGLTAMQGMNEADRGRHEAAALLLADSARTADAAGRPRQRIWSLGLLARSLLLAGRPDAAAEAAKASADGARSERWNAFLPWPQAIHAECLARAGRWSDARTEAEESFALAAELGDPCWEGMAARMLSLSAAHDGEEEVAWQWILDARRRCDRVPDAYVWVSRCLALTQVELAGPRDPGLAGRLAHRLDQDSQRLDLPEFRAWALVHRARSGDRSALHAARVVASTVDNPRLHQAVAAEVATAGGPDELR